jgi:DHA3 family macrolide efflux protein-like MFS transporter
MPLSMGVVGVLAEFIPLRLLMTSCFVVMMLCFTPLLRSGSFRRFISFDPERDTPESMMGESHAAE